MTTDEVLWVWLLCSLEQAALWFIALYVRQSLLLHVKLIQSSPRPLWGFGFRGPMYVSWRRLSAWSENERARRSVR